MRFRTPAVLFALTLTALGCDKLRKEDAPPPPPRDDAADEEASLRTPTRLSDYSSVCTGTKMRTQPYQKRTDATPSKVAVFTKWLDEKTPIYGYAKPDGMGVVQAAGDDESSLVELVACVDLLKKEKSRSQCNYYGGKVERWTMVHTVRIVEARTGKELAKDEFEIDPLTTGCAGSRTFASGVTTIWEGGEYGGRLLTTLLPLQPDAVALPELTASDLADVCTGTPRPQTAKPKEGTTPAVHVVYRPEAGYSWMMEARPKNLPDNTLTEKEPTSAKYVACVTGKPEKLKQSCKFMMGSTLEAYDGTVEVVVYEAATRKVVGTKSFSASSASCPNSHEFWGDPDKYFGKVDAAIGEWIYSHVGGLPAALKPKAAAPQGGGGLYQMLH